jgi:hypothetical protein
MATMGPVSENIDDAQSAGAAAAGSGGQVLTFDEIDNLTAESGKPAETLMNVVALIAQRICWSRTAPTWYWRQHSGFGRVAWAVFAWR